MNAGCTTELGRVRLVAHAAGRILSERWLEVSEAVHALPAAQALPAAA
jgi:hypothetical protein